MPSRLSAGGMGSCPRIKEIIDHYSKDDKYDNWVKNEHGRDMLWKRRLALVKRDIKSGRLLDVGTGIGQFLAFARDDFEVTGTEVSKSAIGIANKKYGLDIHNGTIEELDFKGKKFDIITVFHVLEHVRDPVSLIKKCRGLLKENGFLIIAVPNEIDSLASFVKRILRVLKIGRFKDYSKIGLKKIILGNDSDEIHLSYFTESVLKEMLQINGFKLVRCTLDRSYSAVGVRRIIHTIFHYICSIIYMITQKNVYGSIWIVCQKKVV